jgi:hypothetical protein
LAAKKGKVINTAMSWIDYWNRKVKQFTIWDLKLAQLWTAMWILIIVKIFPQIIQISVWWFVVIAVLCAPRLFYVLWIKKNSQPHAAPEAPPRAASSEAHD